MEAKNEMQKLKYMLDENGIDWEQNDSEPEEPYQFERIRFKIGKEVWSVIRFVQSANKKNTLEMWNLKKKDVPIDGLTATQVLSKLGIIKTGQLGREE